MTTSRRSPAPPKNKKRKIHRDAISRVPYDSFDTWWSRRETGEGRRRKKKKKGGKKEAAQ